MEKLLANFPVAQRGLQLITVKGPESGFFFNAPLLFIHSLNWEGETKDPLATLYTWWEKAQGRTRHTEVQLRHSVKFNHSDFIEHPLWVLCEPRDK